MGMESLTLRETWLVSNATMGVLANMLKVSSKLNFPVTEVDSFKESMGRSRIFTVNVSMASTLSFRTEKIIESNSVGVSQ